MLKPLPEYEERRASPRIPMAVWVREAGTSAPFEMHQGNVSVGGAFWRTAVAPTATEFEIRVYVPVAGSQLTGAARLVRTSALGEEIGVHVAVEEMPVASELELARLVTAHQAWASQVLAALRLEQAG